MKNFRRILLLVFLIALVCSVSVFGTAAPDRDYWPGETWRTSTPEEQGMDSERIYSMLKYLEKRQDAHSVLIIRNGYLITEAYFQPYHRDSKQNICSCTKSFTSALIGIGIREGLIKDVQQKVVDFFPEYSFANPSERKKAITIENLLTMTPGFDWNDNFNIEEMEAAEDSVQYMLDRQMVADPRPRFINNSGASQLLSAVIAKTSGTTTSNFANQYLFEPLGIANVNWLADKKGINLGGTGLILSPTDMARFGYLYLRKGVWNGRQIIPADWVEVSTKAQIATGMSLKYGYHWWVESSGFAALGWGGQTIYVNPGLDLVAVFTNGTMYHSDFPGIADMFLIPAVKSDQPLPPNPKMTNQIKKLGEEFENPKAKPVSPLPKLAAQISGKVIECEANQGEVQRFSLRFHPKNTCFLKITWMDGSSFENPVGLDGVYRIAVNGASGPEAMKGAWVSGNQFLLNWQTLQAPERYDISFEFNGEDVEVTVSGSVQGPYEIIKGKLRSL